MIVVLWLSLRHTSLAFHQQLHRTRLVNVRHIRTLSASAKGGKERDDSKKPANEYAETILLPETDFSQRANAQTREPQIQAFWNDRQLYQTLSKRAAESNAPRFVLHDGPPYANGDLHCGHALNKIIKDIINRYQVLQGKQVHFVPGWDCHGLPIELKVLQNMKSKEREMLTPVTLRQKAAAFAESTVTLQSKAFQRYGIFGDFDHPYLTMQSTFEAAQIRVFGAMFQRGFIFRGRKPVHWSPSSQTALAEAELEYPDHHISKSIYVAFDVVEPSEALAPHVTTQHNLRVAIWTTTPWTIPANLAVAVNPQLEYAVVSHEKMGNLIVAIDLIPTLAQKFKIESTSASSPSSFEVLTTLSGGDLVGTTYRHPLYADRISPIVAGGDYITTESGTGLVHTAPGHGQEDYLTGLKYGLELLSPVNDYGQFTAQAGLGLEGLSVLGEGNTAVIDKLSDSKALLLQEDYSHKYPYDWRTKKPTIFRATDQWFASVEGFRAQALDAIDTVQWVPSVGINRIKSFVAGRGDWCISRQRSWGVPIPVFYNRENNSEVLLNERTLEHIEKLFAKHGSDVWWTMEERDLLPEEYRDEAHQWKKGTDTMDVWFDSGSSWAGVAQSRDELAFPADLYVEGSDQHRGWFQSSLLTSVATTGGAPFKTVVTHGFVLDEKGFKMSKSLGNVLDPRKVIEGGNNKKTEPAYGADVLRLWVANSDYSSDVLIGDNIIQQTFDIYRKLRITARFMIGNLADFVPAGTEGSTAVPYDDLPSLDKYMLGRLSQSLQTINEAMAKYQFQRAVQELMRFATTDLSNFYFDLSKDRLYISGLDDFRRKSCQTVLYSCLEGFTKAIAPILPHMAEDIWQNLPYKKSKQESVFEDGWPSQVLSFAPSDEELWDLVRNLKEDVNKCLQLARSDKVVGASLEGAAYVHFSDEQKRALLTPLDGDENLVFPPEKTNGVDELRTVLMVSQIHLVNNHDQVVQGCGGEKYVAAPDSTLSGATVGVVKTSGKKCGRCWFYDNNVGKLGLPHGTDLCQRCDAAITMWENRNGKSFSVGVAAPSEESEQTANV